MGYDDRADEVSAGASDDHAAAPRDTHLVSDPNDSWAGTRMMIALVGAVVLLLAMKSAASVVAPIVLALVVAVGVAPAIGWLERRGVGTSMAFAVTVIAMVVLEIALVILLSGALASFALSLPDYEDQFNALWAPLEENLKSAGIDVDALLQNYDINYKQLITLGLQMLASLTNLFSVLILVTFTAIFMLLEATTIGRKMEAAGMAGSATAGRIARLAEQLRSFVKVSAFLGAIVAIIETVLLLLLDVPNAILWGLLSFFFSFIPYVGFVLALVPPTVMALLTGGWTTALIVIVGYTVINNVSDSVFKPKIMGASTDMSPLAVFVSLTVFGWSLGLLGGLLAVPMLLIVKALLFDPYPEWRFLSVVLANAPAGQADTQQDSKQGGSADSKETS